MYSRITEIAMMALPMTMNGRNLPNLPFVLSISAPIIGSVIASKTRIPVIINDANAMLSPSTRLPKVEMKDKIST